MATRIPITTITIISSSRVKPAWRSRRALPVTVLASVQGLARDLGVDVVHVVPAPGVLVGGVLVAAQAPFLAAGHGIDGDAPQPAALHAVHAADGDAALHQQVQALGVVLVAQ